MKRSELIRILLAWNPWQRELDTGVPREGPLAELERLARLGEITVVSGVRRCGKSTLLLQLCRRLMEGGVRKEDILIINLEDHRLGKPDLSLLDALYEAYVSELDPSPEHYVVLDEVQVVDGWERFARYLHESRHAHTFVTGSGSKLLGSDYATVLSGRHVDLRLRPLSFGEFLAFRGMRIESGVAAVAHRHGLRRHLAEYLRWGGFPKVALVEDEAGKRDLLDAYFGDIVVKDVVRRHKVKEVEKLEDLTRYYLSNVSSLQSFNRTRRAVGLSLDTVERFSRYLEDALLVSFTRRFSYSLKEQLANPRKVYCVDPGLRNAAGFTFSEDLGRLAENAVFAHLSGSGREVFHWRDVRQREVDFLVRRGGSIEGLVQVAWDLEGGATRGREVGSLLAAMKALGLDQGTILTEDLEDEERVEGRTVRYVPLWRWLVEPFGRTPSRVQNAARRERRTGAD